MRMSKRIKKAAAIILALVMMFGAFVMPGTGVTAKASDSPVKMYCCDHLVSFRGVARITVYIQVDARSASTKEVYLHHTQYSDNDWKDTKAEFYKKIDSNTEIWRATIGVYESCLKYAIKYIGDGNIYWDNNNGNNYTYNNVLGTANVKSSRLCNVGISGALVRVKVKNLGYEKKVKIVYTLDNWNSKKEASLSYSSSISGTNEEEWSTNLQIEDGNFNQIKFCISYEVNNNVYWDNNFGENYDINYIYNP